MNRFKRLYLRQDIRSYIVRSWAVSWPLIFIMFFEFLINLTDVFIAGKISKEVQAAYGFVTQIYFILTVLGNALTVGTVSVISRLCTSVEDDEYPRAVFSTVMVSIGAGFALSVIGIVSAPFVLNLLHIPIVIKQYGTPLAMIYSGGLVFHYVLINSNGILRSCKGVKKSLFTMAVISILNIILNFTFVFCTPLGYIGIALSTALSVMLGSLINLWFIRELLFRVKKISWPIIKKIVAIGWPSGLLQVNWQFASMILFLILTALPENNIETVAAFTNGLRIEAAIYLPAFAFNMANAVVIGNLLGEKKMKDAFRSGLVTATIGVVIVSVIVVLVITNAGHIVSLLSDNNIVISETKKYLYICMAIEPIMAWGVIMGGGLSGAGDTRGVMKVIALSLWLVRIPFAYLFGLVLGWGATGVYWAMNMSLITQAFFLTKRYLKKGWLNLD